MLMCMMLIKEYNMENKLDVIVSVLTTLLVDEMTAISQYMLHASILSMSGLFRLAQEERDRAISEMEHAEKLIHRIVFYGGLPKSFSPGAINVGKTVDEIVKFDLDLELTGISHYKQAITKLNADELHSLSDVLLQILHEEEAHLSQYQAYDKLITSMTLPGFLMSYQGSSSKPPLNQSVENP